MGGRLDPAHVGALGQPGDPVCHVGPRRAVVTAHLHVAIVGAHVEQPAPQRRLREAGDVAVGRRPVVDRHLRLGARHAHDLELLAIDLLREIDAAHFLPRHAVVPRAHQEVPAQVDGRRIVGRELERRVPVVAVGLGGVAVLARAGDGPHGGLLAGGEVVPVHVPALRLGEDDRRVGGVHDGEEAVAVGHLVPVLMADAVEGEGVGGPAPGVVVLQPAAHEVRIAHVVADGVELAQRQVVEHAPVRGAVPARGQAAVASQDDMVGIVGVDPERVVVDVHLLGAVAAEGAPAVVGHHQAAPEHVDAVHVRRVDAHL